jgi:tetratricopeptide (TPR) repeat protein
MDPTYDYNGAFKATVNKLKKRFLRKPNISEAIDEYTFLSNKLENEQAYTLSAQCQQQVAKLHQSTGNYVLQSGSLQSAAHLFLISEHESTCEVGLVTFGEDLINAVSLYDDAIRVHCDHNEKHLAGKLCVEIADLLTQKYEKYDQALQYYERALTLFESQEQLSNESTNNTLQSILVLAKLGICIKRK